MKNSYRVHLSAFNPELKVVLGFSTSYELQILCLFPFFSKITFFHFIVFLSRLLFLEFYSYGLFPSIYVENINTCFCKTKLTTLTL
jgi:hypothetical protein